MDEERNRRLASGRVAAVRATQSTETVLIQGANTDLYRAIGFWTVVRPAEFIGSEITPAPCWIISDQCNLPYRSGKHVNMAGQNKSHQPSYGSLHSSLGCDIS